MTPEHIKALRAEVKTCEDRLRDAKQALDIAQIEHTCAKWDIHPGDKVKSGQGKLGIVARVRTPFDGDLTKPWLYVHPINKDGAPSKAEKTFYNWEKVS